MQGVIRVLGYKGSLKGALDNRNNIPERSVCKQDGNAHRLDDNVYGLDGNVQILDAMLCTKCQCTMYIDQINAMSIDQMAMSMDQMAMPMNYLPMSMD
jgi:hypothetical protein